MSVSKKQPFHVFIGWSDRSGDSISNQTAELLKDLIESSVIGMRVFLSKSSLRAGGNWFDQLRSAASQASWGLFCLSEHNHWARWMAFEAGLLSKVITGTSQTSKLVSRVVPLLIGNATAAILKDSPFANYQSRSISQRKEMEAMLEEMIIASPDPDETRFEFSRRFSRSWKIFSNEYEGILQAAINAERIPAELSPKEMAVFAAMSHLAATIHDAAMDSQHASRHQPDVKLLLGDIFEGMLQDELEFPNVRKILDRLKPHIQTGTVIRTLRMNGRGALQ